MMSESSTILEHGGLGRGVGFEYFGHLTYILYFVSCSELSLFLVDVGIWVEPRKPWCYFVVLCVCSLIHCGFFHCHDGIW